jgi:hypothetical protein
MLCGDTSHKSILICNRCLFKIKALYPKEPEKSAFRLRESFRAVEKQIFKIPWGVHLLTVKIYRCLIEGVYRRKMHDIL